MPAPAEVFGAVVALARNYRILRREQDGTAVYESKGPDHWELLTVRPDGLMSSDEMGVCGFCLDEAEWCEYHPDGNSVASQADVDVMPSPPASRPGLELVPDIEPAPEPEPEPEPAQFAEVEKPPQVSDDVHRTAEALAKRV
jgi:hypothetical protein